MVTLQDPPPGGERILADILVEDKDGNTLNVLVPFRSRNENFPSFIITESAFLTPFPLMIGLPSFLGTSLSNRGRIDRYDGNATAIGMVRRNHIVNIGKLGKEFGLYPAQCRIENPRDVLDCGMNGEDVAGTAITVLFPGIGITLEKCLLSLGQERGRPAVGMEGARFRRGRQIQHSLVYPAAGLYILPGI
jgi:hypothetical protein